MKSSIFLLSCGAFTAFSMLPCASAQGPISGGGGSSPFSRVYAPPANNPAPEATPNPAFNLPPGASQGGYYQGNAPSYSSEPIDPNHKLNAGDQLSFQVAEDRSSNPPDTLTVTAAGDVNIPLAGLMPAAGKSVAQFSSEVKAKLEREYYYHATVMMGLKTAALRQSRGRVYVTGAVHNIGPIDLPVDETFTVSKAIIKSAGFKDIADMRRVHVLNKDGTERGVVDVKSIMDGKDRSKKGDLVLEPGDTVVVKERTILF